MEHEKSIKMYTTYETYKMNFIHIKAKVGSYWGIKHISINI